MASESTGTANSETKGGVLLGRCCIPLLAVVDKAGRLSFRVFREHFQVLADRDPLPAPTS